jgi:outer membrane protein assembly factor BamB
MWNIPVGAGAFSPCAADWDGDGAPEIVGAAAEGRATVLAGVDGYALETVSTAKITAPAVAGDVDGDGKADLVVATYDDMISAYSPDGRRLWQASTGGTVTGTPLLCDFNGDGALDVVFASWGGILGVVSGKDGSVISQIKFDAALGITPALILGNPPAVCAVDVRGIVRRFDWAYGKLNKLWERSLAPSSVLPVGIVPADINGDRKPDIVVATNHGLIAALNAKNGKALWQADAGGPVTFGPAVGNVRGDAGAEIVAVVEGTELVLLSGADGGVIDSDSPFEGRIAGAAIADISGQGKSKIIATVIGRKSVSGIALISGENNFEHRMLPTPAEPTGVPAVGDFNSDGVTDLAVGTADGRMSLITTLPGPVKWNTEFGAPMGPPRLRTVEDRIEIGLVASSGGLVWFDAETGLPASIRADIPGGHWTAADINDDGIVDAVVSAGGIVRGYDGRPGGESWEYKAEADDVTIGPPACAELPDGAVVIVGGSDGVLHALSGESGTEKWKVNGATAHLAEPVVMNVRGDSTPEIICATREHGLLCLNAIDGSILWGTNLKGEPAGAPAVYRSGRNLIMVALAAGKKVYIVDAAKGEVLRTITERDRITSPPTLVDMNGNGIAEVLYTTSDGKLVVRTSSEGKEVWSEPVSGFSRVPVLVADLGGEKMVFSLDAKGRLDALSAAGEPKWRYGRVASTSYVNPVMAVLSGRLEGIVLVTDRGLELIGPDMGTNSIRWSHEAAQMWK